MEHMQRKREEEEQRKRELEEKRLQELEMRKKRNAERAQKAAEKRRQEEEKRLNQRKKAQVYKHSSYFPDYNYVFMKPFIFIPKFNMLRFSNYLQCSYTKMLFS